MTSHPKITLLDDGFSLCGANEEVLVSFAEVCAIRAHKIDLFNIDEIRVNLE